MRTNKNTPSGVPSGPHAAILAMEEEAVQTFLKGESTDPAQIIERLEKRAEFEGFKEEE